MRPPLCRMAGSVNTQSSRVLLVGILSLTLWSAQTFAQADPKLYCLAEGYERQCEELVAERSLFPTSALGASKLSSFPALWYSEHLAAMGETALAPVSDQPSEVYRFLWLRTFDQPVAIRLQTAGGVRTLFVKQLNGAGGYDPGVLVVNRTIEIGAEDWDRFLRLLVEADYWRRPTADRSVDGLDGARWVLEAVKDGRYHIVDRWSPDQASSSRADLRFRDACLFLLELSGLENQPSY